MKTISMGYGPYTKGSPDLPLRFEIWACNFPAMLAMWTQQIRQFLLARCVLANDKAHSFGSDSPKGAYQR